jgi:NADPH:quinone reductase-like Zn-dependent oxidoreductase
MRAAWFEEFGAAKDVLKLGEIEAPAPGPGEVLVRLYASGINPSDVKKRAGSFPDLLDGGFVIPDSDGAGVIEAVGEDVDKSRVGERVWVFQAQYARRFGTAAEYVAISSNCAPRLSSKAEFDVGACLGIPVMTAHRAVFADGDVEGQTILVTGGAGRVGYYAVQWARHAGANVIATASTSDDADTCSSAGANHIVNHRDPKFAKTILACNDGNLIDRVIDVEFGANLPVSVEVLRVGGTIATYASTQVPQPKLPFFQMMYKDLTIRMIIVYAIPDSAKDHAIADINKALADDWLQHRIAHRLPLEEIAKGNEIIEKGTCRGAVILEID